MVCVSRRRVVPRGLVVLGVSCLALGWSLLPAGEPPANDTESTSRPLLPFASEGWRYLDSGEDPGEDWTTLAFADASWKSGKALLGYGDDDVNEELSFGEDADAKHAVCWFRRRFRIEALDGVLAVAGRIICDDAAAVYVNEREVLRKNLPEGELTETTWASTAVSGAAERERTPFLVEPKDLAAGDNVVAVRVHQANASSSDLAFDLELLAITDAEAHRKLTETLEELRAARQEAIRLQLFQNLQRQGAVVLHDGVVTSEWFDGVQRHSQRMVYDVIEQAKDQCGVTFVRVYAGDTLEKIAARQSVPAERLRLLNRRKEGFVFRKHDLVCLNWTHTVGADETIESIASRYGTSTTVLRKLNPWLETGGEPSESDSVLVPGPFFYDPPRGDQLGNLHLAHVMAVERTGLQRRLFLGGDVQLGQIKLIDVEPPVLTDVVVVEPLAEDEAGEDAPTPEDEAARGDDSTGDHNETEK